VTGVVLCDMLHNDSAAFDDTPRSWCIGINS